MNKNFFYLMALCVVITLPFFTSCNDDDDPAEEPAIPSEYIYVLSSGDFGANNAVLSMYNLKDGAVTKDIFEIQNGRRLGDTGQDLIVYGSKIYIAMYGEFTIEVTDLEAKTIQQIETEGQPRYFAAYEGKIYVTYYDGYVARIDTASLEVEDKVKVGRNPEQLTVADKKLYVANSGGMDYNTPTGYDNTVSVIDIASFTETKKITVEINPYDITSDNSGNVYVASRGNYVDILNTLQKIDKNTGDVSIPSGLNGTFLTVVDNILYTIHSQYDADGNQVITYCSYDMANNKILSDNFVGDTEISGAFGISSDKTTGEVYIMASDYENDGDVYIFDKDNKFVNKFEVGLNPMKAVRVEK